MSAHFIDRILTAIEEDVVPKTSAAVEKGNKVFGACVLRKDTLETFCADTNNEMQWPLLHGEVSLLQTLSRVPHNPKDLYFIATHEPCPLCLSAITWSGYDNFYYLFTYSDTKDAFSIPHDLLILDQVFKCPNGSYRRENSFWKGQSVQALVDALDDEDAKKTLQDRIEALRTVYARLSDVYQLSKADNHIPLS